MQKGDAYYVPVRLAIGGEIVSTGDVKIKIGSLTKTCTYDATQKAWVFQLTQAETLAMDDMVEAQVGWKKDNDNIIYSAIKNIYVKDSLLGLW